MLMASNFRLADLITIMNGVCGTLSIISSARYLLESSNLPGPLSKDATRSLYTAIFLPMLGFGFDALDGKVARWMGGGSMLGQEMDSLADLISFGVAPATLGYVMGLRSLLDVMCLLLFVSCGLARLARFNATVALIPADASGKSKYFEGLPIPSSLFLDALMAYFVHSGWFAMGAHGDLPLGQIELVSGHKGTSVHVLSIIFAVWAAAMVSKTLRVGPTASAATDVRSLSCREVGRHAWPDSVCLRWRACVHSTCPQGTHRVWPSPASTKFLSLTKS